MACICSQAAYSHLHLYKCVHQLMDHLANDPEDPDLSRRMTEDYDFGYQVKFDRATKKNKKYWTNPLSLQLPQAPSMRSKSTEDDDDVSSMMMTELVYIVPCMQSYVIMELANQLKGLICTRLMLMAR